MFLSWIPIGYIFDFNVIPLLVFKVMFVFAHSYICLWLASLFAHMFLSDRHLSFLLSTQLPHSFNFNQFLNIPAFHNVTLQCLSEIATLKGEGIEPALLEMFHETMTQLTQVGYFVFTIFVSLFP